MKKNLRHLLCMTYMLSFSCFLQPGLSAQNIFPSTGNVGIGTTTPATSALLEVKSTTKGILIPRMTQAQRDVIPVSSSVNGLLIYQTNGMPGIYYYNAGWKPVGANVSLSNLGATTLINTSLTPGTNNVITLGTTTKRWKNVYTYGITFADGTIQTTAAWKISAANVYFNTGNVGIGTNAPASSAILDVKSTTKGVLIPRMTQAQRNVIPVSSVVNGMVIYQTDNLPGFYYFNAGWKPIGANPALSNLSATTLVNASLTPATNNLITVGTSAKRWKTVHTYSITFPDGTTQATAASASSQWKSSGSNIYFNTGLIGVGTTAPVSPLHVIGSKAVSLTTHGYLLLGDVKKNNITMDPSYIQARFNGAASDLYLNYFGGSVYAGYYDKSFWGVVGAGKYEGLYGYSYDSSGIGTYGYSSLWHGIYGYTGGGLGSDPQGSSGVYGYNASYGYGVGGYCYNGAGVFAYSESYDGLFARGNPGWYAGFFLGNVYSTGTFIPSDLKLKQKVTDITSAMDLIHQLHPRQYEYRQDGNYRLMNLPKGKRFGLLADDLEKVLPDLVKETKFNSKDAQRPQPVDPKDRSFITTSVSYETINFKAVNYTELIPVMIKGMQEQQSLIEGQQQQIDQLKQMVQNLMDAKSPVTNPGAIAGGAYLLQNSPNPFSKNTLIRCFVPALVTQSKLEVYNASGQVLKSYTLASGMNNITIDAGILPAGEYSYLLFADSKKVDAKKMIITR